MRGLLLFLSRRHALRTWMETSPSARRLASRFVAGDTLEDALAVGRRFLEDRITTTLDDLGESVTSLAEADQARDVDTRALRAMVDAGLEGNVSIKLTQFGLDVDEAACSANVERLVGCAADIGGFVRIDMESSADTDRTLALVTRLHARYGSVGTVMQAYLRRTRRDVERLCHLGIRVRLCKGAYLEHASVAFPEKADVDRNYLELMQLLLREGTSPAIATHDERLIAETRRYADAHRMGRDRFEFQMLYGIRRDLQRKLAAEGYRVRVYVPFGKAWYPYFMRRLAERPANLGFLLRNLLRR
jgi:proline dehydrogenase